MIEASWLLFVIASLALIATPGQDMILVMSRSVAQGALAALSARRPHLGLSLFGGDPGRPGLEASVRAAMMVRCVKSDRPTTLHQGADRSDPTPKLRAAPS
jgi:hypothetical protein